MPISPSADDSKLFAFVLMPFDKAFDDLYKLGIKEPAGSVGVVAERVDEQIYRDPILEQIYRQIDTADIVIAEMTGKNTNVFYEVGYAHAKKKLCILSTANAEDIPFDLKHRRHIVHGNSIQALRIKLLDELAWAKSEIDREQRSHVQVIFRPMFGTLQRTKYHAIATIDFKVDLWNRTDSPSAEIEAIYFYSTEGWAVYQNGVEVSHVESDLPTFDKRHFLASPVRRLHRNGWAPVRFSAKGIVANAFKGQELKEEYHIKKWTTVRLVTAQGDFDHALDIDVNVGETPF